MPSIDSFLTLTDIMMTNFLKSMVLDSLIKLEQTIFCSGLEPKVEMSSIDVRSLGKRRLEQGSKIPLFKIVVNFKKEKSGVDGEDLMIISPTLEQLESSSRWGYDGLS